MDKHFQKESGGFSPRRIRYKQSNLYIIFLLLKIYEQELPKNKGMSEKDV